VTGSVLGDTLEVVEVRVGDDSEALDHSHADVVSGA
jgi:hypothetical protein